MRPFLVFHFDHSSADIRDMFSVLPTGGGEQLPQTGSKDDGHAHHKREDGGASADRDITKITSSVLGDPHDRVGEMM